MIIEASVRVPKGPSPEIRILAYAGETATVKISNVTAGFMLLRTA
jgi:hypothetical protein